MFVLVSEISFFRVVLGSQRIPTDPLFLHALSLSYGQLPTWEGLFTTVRELT